MAIPETDLVTPIVNSNDRRSLYVVDDEQELLTTLAGSLRTLGLQPRTFQRSADLLAVTHDGDIGCVITDLRMPEMSGVELIKSLNERESCLSVILLTAFADVSTAVDVMKLGATSVIEKPFQLQRLQREIESAIQNSEQTFERREKLRDATRRLEELTEEECAVLDLAVAGCPNREIAQRLSISPRTVDRRRQSALQKLHTESVAGYAVLKTLVST